MSRGTLRVLLFTALGLAVFPLAIHPIGGYPGLATHICIMAIGAVALNLLLGEAGMLSYGQALFFGCGAYVSAILVQRAMPQHPNLLLAVLGGIVIAAAVAALIGALVVRLYGIYLALLTLAFGQMGFFIVEQAKDWTNGDDGLQGIPAALLYLGPAGIDLQTPLPAVDLGPFGNLSDVHLWYVFAAFILWLVIWFVRTLNGSQFGEVLAAIRENEDRSRMIGFVPHLYRFAAFVIAGALTGLAGGLLALYDLKAVVDDMDINRSGSFVIYTVVGGVHTLLGPAVGTAVIMYLEDVGSGFLAKYPQLPGWQWFEGLIFVLVIVFLPAGIVGTLKRKRKPDFEKLLAVKR